MNTSNFKYWLTDSRWIWLLKGLPSLSRASALFQVRNNTMTTAERCRSLWNLSQMIVSQNVPGAFVECGVWRGGSTGIMGLALKTLNEVRQLHLFDSFEGLPEPGPKDGKEAKVYSGGRAEGRLSSIAKCDATLQEVRMFLFDRLRLDPTAIQFHVGWFQQTVPVTANKLEKLAMLRLDGDWYESTRICLEHLYPKLSQGGVLILDDYYCWEGCRKATDEYREAHGIASPVVRVDKDCCYWIKQE